MNMDFPKLGTHCNVKWCNQLDYLPFECEYCHLKFCAEHKEHKEHNCQSYENRERRAEPCPVCNQLITIPKNENIDEVIAQHLSTVCGTSQKGKPKSFGCTFKGCKTKEFVECICDKCRSNYCFKHRFPSSHKCNNDIKLVSTSPPSSLFKNQINNNNNTTSTTTTTTNNTRPATNTYTKPAQSDYLTQQRKQQDELKQLRLQQNSSYKSNQEYNSTEIDILLTNGDTIKKSFNKNDTFKAIQQFINQNRTDGKQPYAIITESNPQPFSSHDLDLTLGELNLFPKATLVMVVS